MTDRHDRAGASVRLSEGRAVSCLAPGRWAFNWRFHAVLTILQLLAATPRSAVAGTPKSGDASVSARAEQIFLPVPANYDPARIGAATFRCGAYDTVVLAAPLKIAKKRIAGGLGAASVRVTALPQATVLRIRLPATAQVRVTAADSGITLTRISSGNRGVGGILPTLTKGQVTFRAAQPGKVVSIVDPCLGGPLLVGTVLNRDGFHGHLQGPGYSTVPAGRGVVVRAESDQLQLSAGHHRFILTSVGGPALPVGSPPATASALDAAQSGPWRGFPRGSRHFLRRHLASAMREEASAPPLARSKAALRVARAMLSLGMGAEAEGVLSDMLRHDPAAVSDPARETTLAIAAILTHRSGRALAALPESGGAGPNARADRLWRGLAFAEQRGSQRAAALIAMGVNVLLTAPRYLRAVLAPLAAETLVNGGELAAAKRIFSMMPHAPSLRLAKAEAAEANGKSRDALAALEKLVDSPNNRVAGIAAFRTIMLRYKLHRLAAKDAAAALSKTLYIWRGPRHELTMRMALARVQARAGDWAQAMQGLRHARHRFPFARDRIERERRTLFDRLLASGRLKTMPAIRAVAILQNNKDLFPAGRARAKLLDLYADRLASLDLNDEARHARAAAKALLNATPSPSPTPAAPPVLADAAIGRLTVGGDDGQKSGKAREAQASAADIEKKPVQGMLDDKTVKHVLAEANRAAEAGDRGRLRDLRKKYRDRVPQGLDRALFDAATAPPVGPDPKLDAALRQIAIIEHLGTELGKPDAPGKGAASVSGAKPSGASPSPQEAGSAGS